MNDFGFEEESRRVRPAQSRSADLTSSLGQTIRLNACERARARNTGNARVFELVPSPRVQGNAANRGLPFTVGRTRGTFVAGDVSGVGDLESFHSASRIFSCCRPYRISHHDVGNVNDWPGGYYRIGLVERNEASKQN